MRLRRLTDWLVYLAVRTAICIAQAVRIETCAAIAGWLAYLANDVARLRHQVTDENLRHVYPNLSDDERSELARGMWRHLILMACEIAHVQRKIHDTNWRQYVRVRNKRQIVRYLLDNRPLVIVSGHFGNFEVAGVMTGLLGFPTHTVARLLDNPFLDRYINRFRATRGQYMLPKDGSSQQVQDVLDAGGSLVLLGDQAAGPRGCWVDFLGRSASCHKAIALLTLTSNAPLVVAYARRLDQPLQFELGLEGVVDPHEKHAALAGVKPLTQWYNQQLERLIRTDPDQYWWLHRRWKGQPPQRRRRDGAAERRVA